MDMGKMTYAFYENMCVKTDARKTANNNYKYKYYRTSRPAIKYQTYITELNIGVKHISKKL